MEFNECMSLPIEEKSYSIWYLNDALNKIQPDL